MNNQGVYTMQKLLYDCAKTEYKARFDNDLIKQQALDQRKLALITLFQDLDVRVDSDDLYYPEIIDMAHKGDKLLDHFEMGKYPSLTAKGRQLLLSDFYEALIAQNRAYHDGLLVRQLGVVKHGIDNNHSGITELEDNRYNTNYAERINGYIIAALSFYNTDLVHPTIITADDLRKLQDHCNQQLFQTGYNEHGQYLSLLVGGKGMPKGIIPHMVKDIREK